MIFTVYILGNLESAKTYVGFTNHLILRFRQHNDPMNKGWTKRHQPWIVLFTFIFSVKEDAMKKEKFLKTGVGREFISKNKSDWFTLFH